MFRRYLHVHLSFTFCAYDTHICMRSCTPPAKKEYLEITAVALVFDILVKMAWYQKQTSIVTLMQVSHDVLWTNIMQISMPKITDTQ